MKFPSLHAGLLLALFVGGMARADTILSDNLGTSTNGFRSVSDTTWEAQKFSSDATNFLLTSATLTLFSGSAGSGNFFLGLFSDAAGQPGTSLATLFTGPNPFPGPAFPQNGNILFGGLSQLLAPNTNYWLVLGESAGSVLDIRWGATSSATGTGTGFVAISASTSNQGAGWSLLGGSPDQMQVTVVPEPGSGLLGLLGGGGLLVTRRRRRR